MNLTSLANVRAWVNSQSNTDDALLQRMITACSYIILTYLQRPDFVRTSFTELRDGVGNARMMLRNWPVIAVSSVSAGACGYNFYAGQNIPVSANNIPVSQGLGQPGYVLQPWDGSSAGKPQTITLTGYLYPRGNSNVQFVYSAGYCVVGEARTVPAVSGPYTLTPNAPYGPWAQDDGVSYATGAALTKVASNPAQGQYSIAQDATTAVVIYTFNAADASTAILLNYSFVPTAIEQACIEWVGERYRYKSRIGQTAQSIQGAETNSFSLKGMPDFIEVALNPYRKAFPI